MTYHMLNNFFYISYASIDICEFMLTIQLSDVQFSIIGNQLIDKSTCAGFLRLGYDKYKMTAMECGQLTRANKHCGYSFFHSENGKPQGHCFCEANYVEEPCQRQENYMVTEYRLQESNKQSTI